MASVISSALKRNESRVPREKKIAEAAIIIIKSLNVFAANNFFIYFLRVIISDLYSKNR